jgi:hypothetical protein
VQRYLPQGSSGSGAPTSRRARSCGSWWATSPTTTDSASADQPGETWTRGTRADWQIPGGRSVFEDRSPRWIDFGFGDEPCVLGSITVYFRQTGLLRSADTLGQLFGPLLRSRLGQRGLAAIVRRFPEGPSQSERMSHRGMIWAEAMDSSGRPVRASLSTPDPYDFAANSALEISSRIGSLPVALGLVTPFQAFGADFVLGLPGCSRRDIPSSEPD